MGFRKSLRTALGSSSAPGSSPARGQSSAADLQPEQSSGGQEPQQATRSPPTSTGRGSRLFGRLAWRPPSPSPSQSPSVSQSPSASQSPGIQRRNSTAGEPTAELKKSQLLGVPTRIPTRPRSAGNLHIQTSGRSTHHPAPLASGGKVLSVSAHDPASPSPSGIQCSPSTAVIVPKPEPNANKNPAPSAYAPPSNPNVVTNSSSHSSDTWEKALEIAKNKLTENGLPQLDCTNLTSHSAEENIGAIVEGLNNLQKVSRENQWSYTWHGKKVVVMDSLGKILTIVRGYSVVVGAAAQSNQVSALVWAGVQGIMRVASNHIELIEGLEVAIASLVEKMAMCDFYAGIYFGVQLHSQSKDNSQLLRTMLHSALPELYASVIVFAVKARGYFEGGGWNKFSSAFKSFEVELLPFIKEIEGKEKTIRECADAATMQRIQKIEGALGALQEITSELLNGISSKVTHLVPIAEQTRDNTEDHRILELLKMLSPLEPLKRHQDIKSPRSKNAGTWLLQRESFSKWRDSPTIEENDRVFCCYGFPGAGKTVISSVVIDDLRSRSPNVACLYADYKDQNNQTLNNILGTFLRQFLATTRTPISNEITQKLQVIQREGGKAGTGDNLALLKIQLQQLDRAFICIDAIDELDPNVRWKLLKELEGLGATNTCFFLTGRNHIESEVQEAFKLSDGNKVVIRATPQDIKEFVDEKIREDRNSEAMDGKLAKDIIDKIIEKSRGMFLLPSLHIKMVLGMPTRAKRRKALEMLPTGLYDTFWGIIMRIRECHNTFQAELGVRVLMWLHFACRPLQLAELQHALAVENGDSEFDADNIPSRKALLDCCLGLVIVDEETLTVRFVHYTLEEYFHEDIDNFQKIWKEFPNGCSYYIAETCLTYLNFGGLRQHCPSINNLQEKMQEYIFLNYAALYWGNHVKQQKFHAGLINPMRTMVDHESECPPCAIQVLYVQLTHKIPPPWRQWQQPIIVKRFSGTHVMAYFGLSTYMPDLCHMGCMGLRDETGRTPLTWAAEYGHESSVQMLIKRADVDISATDKDGRTPLFFAAMNGHEAVMQVLMEERGGVDTNVRSNDGRTPLTYAAANGHEAAVMLLIKRDGIDINTKDKYEQTPLLWAASHGHEAAVRLLIEKKGIDVEARGKFGDTPLLRAAKHGHEAVVRLLIDRQNVGTNAKDNCGRTPLSWAAERGYKGIVQLLIESGGIDINAEDCNGWTPLCFGAVRGHEAVVRLLIESGGAVDINVKGNGGCTPLLVAAQNGHEAVVRLLIESGHGVDIDAKNEDGETPLLRAAGNGHEAVVQLLIERGGVDINAKDNQGWTSLLGAALNGHEAVVQLLIERGGVDINAKDNDGWTPLLGAAANGHEAVVRRLMEREDVDINAKDNSGRAPLFFATLNSHEAIVQLLSERGAVDINDKDDDHWTPLLHAAANGHETVVRQLIESSTVDINVKDTDGWTPLLCAANNGHEAVVRLLIESSTVDINVKDTDGLTPLLGAALNGHEAVVQLLIERGGVDINAKDNDGWTPLLGAAANGHEAVVRLLIESGHGVDIDAKNENGETPLLRAAGNGHEAVVQLLIERGGVDINDKNRFGQTPLSRAAAKGYEAVVLLLIESGDGVDINAKNEYGETPLFCAAENGHEAVVRLLVERGDVDLNATDNFGMTALLGAVNGGCGAVVQLLIEHCGIDINDKDGYGRTPLSQAASQGHKAIVQLLLETGDADTNTKTIDGKTPLLLAAANGYEAVVRLLIESGGADINAGDKYGLTPLDWADRNGHGAIVQLLNDYSGVQLVGEM